MKRNIITIDEDQCTGCGLCVPNCPEGAIQMIDGKARLVGDLLCDGLGACLGHCPEGAITIEEREAEPYDERKVMQNIVRQGPNTIEAHLKHLRDHGQDEYLEQARAVLKEAGMADPTGPPDGPPENVQRHAHATQHGGCPGSRSVAFRKPADADGADEDGSRPSRLSHWPVQLHLVSPAAPRYRGADVLLSADCVAYAMGDFHKDYLKNKALVIACPKLDDGQDIYLEKIKSLIDDARINTLTVMIMEVPCCSGLLRLARQAAAEAERKVPIRALVVGLQGDPRQDEWV